MAKEVASRVCTPDDEEFNNKGHIVATVKGVCEIETFQPPV
jgi:hypothetical protein